MLSLQSDFQYFLYTPVVDFRKQFDGLAGIVRQHFSERQLMSGAIFIFLNRRRNRIKLLKWDHTGFALYYKRLEQGSFELPTVQPGTHQVQLNYSQLVFLLEGIELKSIRHRKRYQHRA